MYPWLFSGVSVLRRILRLEILAATGSFPPLFEGENKSLYLSGNSPTSIGVPSSSGHKRC